MTDRCNNCGDPRATQALFDAHDAGCDCDTCLGACWAEFGHPCEAPDVAGLRAEVERLRAELAEADDSAHRELHEAAMTNQRREAENMRLRALVEEAYREGYQEGHMDGARDRLDESDSTWPYSDARAALDADKALEDSQ